MLKRFICPDSVVTKVDSCLSGCRMDRRCLTLPSLRTISLEREWGGVPSTTQCLNGTMYEFLKLTKDFCVDPDSRMFMLQGTKHHAMLEDTAKALGVPSEVALSGDRDIFDCIEIEEEQIVITDYKLWGSFKLAKALGLEVIGKEPDPSGAVYKTNSRYGKIGEAKMVPIWGPNDSIADNLDAELQLNRYRVKLADLGVKVDRLQLQVTVRDGGLYIAHNRGVMRNAYILPIKILPDDDVLNFFKVKTDQLLMALKQGFWDTPCSEYESWDGIRCARFCDVAAHCPKGVYQQTVKEGMEEA